MESVARQFARNKKVFILRNGFFSFRWSEIIETCELTNDTTVFNAELVTGSDPLNKPQYIPHNINKIVEQIKLTKPDILFAPHVETATGMILTNDYISQVANAMKEVGGIFVLDGIAAGNIWIDIVKMNVDV